MTDTSGGFSFPDAAERRAFMDRVGRGIGRYIPPEMRPLLGFVAESTPSAALERAGAASMEMVAPDRTASERLGSLGAMLSETAGVAAPMVAAPRAAIPASEALQEALLGASVPARAAAETVFERLNQPGEVPTMYSNPDILRMLQEIRDAAPTGDRRMSEIMRIGNENIREAASGTAARGPSQTVDDLFASMGEEGAGTEYPGIGAALDRYISRSQTPRELEDNFNLALNDPDYPLYRNALQTNLRQTFGEYSIPVTRIEGYADPSAPKTGSTFTISQDDVFFVGSPDERELIARLPDGRVRSVRLADRETAFTDLANMQRGAPELAMLRAQEVMGGGVMNSAVEHIGDLTHRMAERGGVFGREYVAPKIRRSINALESGYGFRREFLENLDANQRARNAATGRDDLNIITRTRAALQDYADAHRQLPVYNEMQRAARDAAVALGEQDFDETLRNLRIIKDALDDGTYEARAMEFPGQPTAARGPREFARGGEVMMRGNMSKQLEGGIGGFAGDAKNMFRGPRGIGRYAQYMQTGGEAISLNRAQPSVTELTNSLYETGRPELFTQYEDEYFVNSPLGYAAFYEGEPFPGEAAKWAQPEAPMQELLRGVRRETGAADRVQGSGNAQNVMDLVQLYDFLQRKPASDLTASEQRLLEEIPVYLSRTTGMADGGEVGRGQGQGSTVGRPVSGPAMGTNLGADDEFLTSVRNRVIAQSGVDPIDVAMEEGVDPDLFLRLIAQESGGRADAQSDAGAYGFTQLMDATARELGVDRTDPEQNLRGGARYLRQQLDSFQEVPLALAAYNAGPGAVRRFGGIPPYSETRAYVARILGVPGGEMGVSPPMRPDPIVPTPRPAVQGPNLSGDPLMALGQVVEQAPFSLTQAPAMPEQDMPMPQNQPQQTTFTRGQGQPGERMFMDLMRTMP